VTAERLAQSDCALILTAHSAFDYESIVRHAPLVFDTRNGTRHVVHRKENVVLL
jgi:UDP-N-acetyl-D-glucosamine dehydrogenase